MSLRSYQKGARRELEFIEIIEHLGAHTIKSAGSKGVWDVVASSRKFIFYAQVMSNAWKRPEERRAMLAFPAPRTIEHNIAFMMVRFDDPRFENGKRTRKARIQVRMAIPGDERFVQVEHLARSFEQARLDIRRLKRKEAKKDVE